MRAAGIVQLRMRVGTKVPLAFVTLNELMILPPHSSPFFLNAGITYTSYNVVFTVLHLLCM